MTPKNELLKRKGKADGLIVRIRGENVIVDADLAPLYGVRTKALIQAVKRNTKRFPEDFMFRLKQKEFDDLRSQFVTSRWGGRRYRPYVFTEQGVAMLSSVLRSSRAVKVNIEIMRAFVRLRRALSTNAELGIMLGELERRVDKNDREIDAILEAIKQLIKEEEKAKGTIGFKP